MSLVLHVGMPKCASSALQTYLSTQEFGADTKNRCAYIALQENGKIVSGKELSVKASASPYGYCASHAGKLLSEYSDAQKREVRAVIRDMLREHSKVVLSCEAWGGNPETLSDDCVFADDDFDVRVVAYIRPQVEWLNSAWWQWGAWSNTSLLNWTQQNRAKAKWHRIVQKWRRKPWVQGLDVRVLDDDIVRDFAAYLGNYPVSLQPQANQGLPDVVLRLFQRNRALRQTAHSSAVEFILSRQIQFGQAYAPTPWVLRPNLIAQLVEYFREDNEALLESLSENQKNRMSTDPRWWDANAYQDKRVNKAADRKLQADELELLTVDALHAITRLDAKLREFQLGWSRLKEKFEGSIDERELMSLLGKELH